MDKEDALDLPETQCQYFVLSPRTSLGGDENKDSNVPSAQVAKGLAKSFKKVATPRCNQQPSVRPSTPTRTRSEAENVLTPHTGRISVRSLPMTPDAQDRYEVESSVAEMSVCSEMSRESRLTQLSRRTNFRRHLSSKELEEMQVEEKRREVRDMIRRNQVNCRKALNASDVSTAGRVVTRPSKMTVPKEFNFSAPPTPRTPRTDLSVCSDSEELSVLTSARRKGGSASARKATPTKQWKPQLTVPKGPDLHTSSRLSTCGSRRSLSCPPEDVDVEDENRPAARRREASVRASTPESRRIEVYAAVSRAERRATTAARAAAAPAAPAGAAARQPVDHRNPAASRPSKKVASTAQERAQLARRLVQQKKDEEARAAQEMMCVFKKPAAAAAATERPRPLVNPPPDWDGAGEMSVCSSRSNASSVLDRTRGMLDHGKGRPKSARGLAPRPSFGSSAARPCMA